MIHCIELHKYKEAVLAKKNIKEIQDKKGNFPFDEEDILNAFQHRYDEIKAALESAFKRVYLIVAPDFEYSGVYRSISSQSLNLIFKKAKDNADKQNTEVCKGMAVTGLNTKTHTRQELIDILDEKSDVPPTIVYSVGTILLNKMGIGLAEAGK